MKIPLSKEDRVTILKLLEMQRQAMFMYTSCGWFFDDISCMETVIPYTIRCMTARKQESEDWP